MKVKPLELKHKNSSYQNEDDQRHNTIGFTYDSFLNLLLFFVLDSNKFWLHGKT